jgi:hypothetical protein
MDNQPGNVNPYSELDKYVQFPREDEPHGEWGPNGGGSGSKDQPRDIREVIPEFESKCLSFIIAGSILAAPGYTVT